MASFQNYLLIDVRDFVRTVFRSELRKKQQENEQLTSQLEVCVTGAHTVTKASLVRRIFTLLPSTPQASLREHLVTKTAYDEKVLLS
jgi:hypothetical protein